MIESRRSGSRSFAPNGRLGPDFRDLIVLEINDHPSGDLWAYRDSCTDGPFQTALESDNIPYRIESCRLAPIYGGDAGFINFILQGSSAAIGALAVILGAWLQQRGNRKMRIKLGDQEFEARTSVELQALLSFASDLRKTQYRDDFERTQALAHQLWIARGRPSGSPDIDWAKAQEILSQL